MAAGGIKESAEEGRTAACCGGPLRLVLGKYSEAWLPPALFCLLSVRTSSYLCVQRVPLKMLWGFTQGSGTLCLGYKQRLFGCTGARLRQGARCVDPSLVRVRDGGQRE